MTTATSSTNKGVSAALEQVGFAFVRGGGMHGLMRPHGSLADRAKFVESWNNLALDTYMADGGRYRRRRHAVFTTAPNRPIELAVHQPHYQALDYNPLNGGVARWFEPIEAAVTGGA